MKNYIYASILAFMLANPPAFAQQDDRRTATTKIADLLATQPAQNADKLNAAMAQLDNFTAADISALLLSLKPQGGDNAKIEYATNSYSYFVMQNGKESMRSKFVQGALDALGKMQDKNNKGYVLNLLTNAGKDDAVSAVSTYLQDEYLGDRAARTLARIRSDEAGKALMAALPSAKGRNITYILEAIGDADYVPAAPTIVSFATAEELTVRKTALYALAKLADPSSEEVLRAAAEKVNFGYDESKATASYINYANNLLLKGNKELAEKVAKTLLKVDDEHTPTRIAGLNILTHIYGAEYVPDLVKASRDKEKAYSIAALKLAQPYLNGAAVEKWGKAVKKANPETQAAIIKALSNTTDDSALPFVEKALKSDDTLVKVTAIKAYGKLKGVEGTPELLKLLSESNQEEREAVKEAFLTLKGEGLTGKLVTSLATAVPADQVTIMQVLANRGANESFTAVTALLKSSDPTVRDAAYNTLPAISKSENLASLTSLLSTAGNENEIKLVQQAIVAAVQGSPQKEQDIQSLLASYQSANPNGKTLYLNVFSGIGEGKALQPVVEVLDGNDANLKAAAVEALANWNDHDALPELIKLSRATSDSKQLNQILNGIVRLTAQSDFPAEQKVLLLRDAMGVAQNTQQKRMILGALSNNFTYNALIFAGKYLDDPELKSAAAMAVLNIALSNPSLYGEEVSAILNKTVDALSGQDSDYLKQALIKHINELPKGRGFVSLFNGKDLTGWKGLVENPIKRAKMSAKELSVAQQKADELMRRGWYVKDGVLYFNGKGDNIATIKQYGDFEMLVDWKLSTVGKEGDAGIYLRGTPQVQIWDTSRVNVGAQVGSGGLYNNQQNESKPLKVADNALGEWNTFRIIMKGDKVTVYLNGQLVTDNVTLENYWDRSQPIFPIEQIELQAHGTEVAYRDIYIKEIPRKEIFTLGNEEKAAGFKVLFDGSNLDSWTGNTTAYTISDEGTLACYPVKDSGGNLYSKEEFGDFIYRFSFRLTPGANNGIGIRAPLEGNAAYEGMEIQVLDNEADIYKDLKKYQYHGSVYGVIPAKRGFLKPVGEWNEEEIYVKGNKIKVTLNGTVILEGDIAEASKNGTLDKLDHPGLKRKSGHIGFLGHGSEVHFKNIRVKRL
ncbi:MULTISPECIES: DUF1080 domain-containing protein [Olivibacter]|jgi:HEAT repeat protein|uniref:DUF1080 domain-containing protein n=1 Tax=Olivibacter oleidegradans TaxID=760123 RepID=A0ABV6HJL3_9SPHI|nr:MULTISPECIES: family 16 glycoside hydrolase [Olivibacter]QEL01531.1 DUF1080 domain-containing protein [Olivibacter sp. LS-1]